MSRRSPLTGPRKNASQDRSRATVDALLAATARILVRDGYDGTSTNKVALAAGVSVGSLYQYFPGKEALVAAVLSRHTDEMMTLVASALVHVADMPVPHATRALVRVMIDAHRVDPKLHRVLVEQIPRVGGMERVERLEDQAILLVRAYLERHRAEIDVADLDLAAFFATTTVEAMTHVAVLRRPELLSEARWEGFVDEVALLVLRYLGAARGPAARLPAQR